MIEDEHVRSALTHWAARFVANGVVLSDFEEIVASLSSWNDWCRAWSQRASVHQALGQQALAHDKSRSAGDHLQRAGVYYHFAQFLFVHDVAQMKAAHAKAVNCRTLALPHLSPPGERVAIAYQNGHLFGILRKPAGLHRPPVMIMCCGLDSAKEETEAYERPFLDRGIATLAFDGPGQGEAQYDWPIRGDYERAVEPVIAYLKTRADIDAARLGLWGVSLGGYYAPRAAAFLPDLKGCIALSGPYDWGQAWPNLPELTRRAFRVRSHAADDTAAQAVATKLSLAGVATNIRCPLFIVTGKQDRVIAWQDAERLAREAAGPVELMIIEDGNHVANNRVYRWRLQSADWMAERLAA